MKLLTKILRKLFPTKNKYLVLGKDYEYVSENTLRILKKPYKDIIISYNYGRLSEIGDSLHLSYDFDILSPTKIDKTNIKLKEFVGDILLSIIHDSSIKESGYDFNTEPDYIEEP